MASAITVCANCGSERSNRFCSVCGQNNRDYRGALWRVIADVVREAFEVDGRLPRTLRQMFLRPGQLAVEFSRNRRASFVSPVRTYVFTSILFFFVLAVTAAQDRADAPRDRPGRPANAAVDPMLAAKVEYAQSNCEGVDVAGFKRLLSPQQRRKVDEILDRPGPPAGNSKPMLCALMVALAKDPAQQGQSETDAAKVSNGPQGQALDPAQQGESETDAAISSFVRALLAFFAGPAVDVLHDQKAALGLLFDNLPLAMFVTLPAYTVLLKLFFFSSRRYYTEHLVFAMHLHSFSFLVYTARMLLPDTPVGGGEPDLWDQTVDWTGRALMVWATVYSYLAMRRYYANGRIRTACKWLVLDACYIVLLIPGFLLSVAATILLL